MVVWCNENGKLGLVFFKVGQTIEIKPEFIYLFIYLETLETTDNINRLIFTLLKELLRHCTSHSPHFSILLQ